MPILVRIQIIRATSSHLAVLSGGSTTYSTTPNGQCRWRLSSDIRRLATPTHRAFPTAIMLSFPASADGSQTLTCTWPYCGACGHRSGASTFGSATLPSTTPLQIGSGVFDLNGGTQQIASVSDYSGGGGSIINSNTAAMAVLTISPTGTTTTYSGTILSGGSNGAVSLVLNGNGTADPHGQQYLQRRHDGQCRHAPDQQCRGPGHLQWTVDGQRRRARPQRL